MKDRKARFDALRERWNQVSAETNKEIEEALKEKEDQSVEIDGLTLKFSTSDHVYDGNIIVVFMDKYNDVYIVTDDGEEHTLGELATGEELWLLWELI